MKKIAAAESQAMTGLLQGHLSKRLAASGMDKDSEFITSQVIEDHKEQMDVLQNVLAEDKREGFDPNDPKLD